MTVKIDMDRPDLYTPILRMICEVFLRKISKSSILISLSLTGFFKIYKRCACGTVFPWA